MHSPSPHHTSKAGGRQETVREHHQRRLLRHGFEPRERLISRLATALGVWEPTEALGFSQGKIISRKTVC